MNTIYLDKVKLLPTNKQANVDDFTAFQVSKYKISNKDIFKIPAQ